MGKTIDTVSLRDQTQKDLNGPHESEVTARGERVIHMCHRGSDHVRITYNNLRKSEGAGLSLLMGNVLDLKLIIFSVRFVFYTRAYMS